MIDFLGINIHESPYAVRSVPNKRHTHRRNQSAAYHKRIQKKWRKRFGTHDEPCAFFSADFGLTSSQAVIMHPKLFAELRNIAPGGTRPGVKTIHTPLKVVQPRRQGKSWINDLLKRFDERQHANKYVDSVVSDIIKLQAEAFRKSYACKVCGCDTRLFGCFCEKGLT